jgi:general stress protein 26
MRKESAKIDHAWRLMERIKVAFFVTHSGDGDQLRARPVHAHPRAGDGAIYFLTGADSAKTYEIGGDRNVCLAFADVRSRKFVPVTGTAAVLDRSKIEELWTKSDRAFWAGPDDPSVRLVRVEPSVAEFWDSDGVIVTAVKIAASSLTGSRLELGRSETVELSNRQAS